MGQRAHSTPPTDPVLEALANAPADDEPVTDEERRAVEEARAEAERGDVLTTAQLRRSLGIA